jgi:chaperonin GroEL
MPKQLVFEDQARRSLKHGVDLVAEAVKTTLGPRGRNVGLGTAFGAPTITHDGVTVAEAISLADPFANMGARLLVEVATRTNELTGDGTTTATVLAQAIIAEGFKLLVAGASPLQLKRGLDKGAVALVAELERMATPVRDRADIAHVAGIAAADPAIGELIAEVMERVGPEGAITVEEGQGLECEVTYSEGMQIARGFLSPHFVTDAKRMTAELDEPLILITDQKLEGLGAILPALEAALEVAKSIVVVAADFDGEALATLVINQLRGTFNVLAVKAPGFGDQRQTTLQDLATLTGATLISEERGLALEQTTLLEFGSARRVVADKDSTTFIAGKGDATAITAHIDQLRSQIKRATSDTAREQLQARLARLTGCVAVLKVGGPTELELKEKQQRVVDALATARAAVAEGIVPGGGVALLNAGCALERLTPANDDERFGIEILRRALTAPLRQLAANAGLEGAVIIEAVRREQRAQSDQSYGYNVLTDSIGSMLGEGIIDPVRVTRAALQNAVSIAGLLLTVEVLIADAPES